MSKGENSLSLAKWLHIGKKADIAMQSVCYRREVNCGFKSEVEGSLPARGE